MNASRFAIQLKVLIATFLPDLLLSMITNNCRCQSHAASLTANSPAPVPQSFCGLLRASKTLSPLCFLLPLFLGEIGTPDVPRSRSAYGSTSVRSGSQPPAAGSRHRRRGATRNPSRKCAKGAGMGEHGERG